MQQVKKEIKLNEKLVATISTINQDIQKLQAEIKAKTDQFSSLISGVCLNEGLDFATEGIYFSDDFTTINVHDLPKKDEDQTEETSKGTKVKKMKV